MNHCNAREGRQSIANAVFGLSSLILVSAGLASFGAIAQAQVATPGSSVDAVAHRLGTGYGEEQMRRLAKNNDRDSLIAAALIGLPSDATAATPDGHAEIVGRLVEGYSKDPLAVYTAALICNVQLQPCTRGDDQLQLLQIAADNAVHVLLLANGGKPTSEQLHRAAAAGKADSHFSELLGIVRTALADQPAPAEADPAVDAKELALALRRQELADVPWPMFAPAAEICNAQAAVSEDNPDLRADCSKLGLALFSDQAKHIVTRMFGSTLIRRFDKGSPAQAEAKEFRRQYLWIDELPHVRTSGEKEQLDEEIVSLGEWEAYQRHGKRMTGMAAAPATWSPKDAQALLLPEERTAAPGK